MTDQPEHAEPIPHDAPHGLGAISDELAEHSANNDHGLEYGDDGWHCVECNRSEAVTE